MTIKEIEDHFYCDTTYKVHRMDEIPPTDLYCDKSCSICPHFFKLVAISR